MKNKERFVAIESVGDFYEVFDTELKETILVNEDIELCERVAAKKNAKLSTYELKTSLTGSQA